MIKGPGVRALLIKAVKGQVAGVPREGRGCDRMLKGWPELALRVFWMTWRLLFFTVKAMEVHLSRGLIHQICVLKGNITMDTWRRIDGGGGGGCCGTIRSLLLWPVWERGWPELVGDDGGVEVVSESARRWQVSGHVKHVFWFLQ